MRPNEPGGAGGQPSGPATSNDGGTIRIPEAEGGGVSRRGFLRGLGVGAGTVLVAGTGALTWRAVDQGVFATGKGPAYEAWDVWRSGDGLMALVRPAILAANAHNSQPWAFELGTDRVDLFADTRRSMGTMDPLRREMVFSLGCALENLVLAARANGLDPELTLLPDPEDETHVARVDLSPGSRNVSELYLAIPDRHTDRAAYDTKRPVEGSTLQQLASLNDEADVALVWLTDEADRRSFGDLTVRATEAIVADGEQAADDYAWYRFDWDEIQAKKDGITFDASGASQPFRALVKLLPTPSIGTSGDGWITATRDRQVGTASAFGLVATPDRGNDEQRLLAGRLYQRLHLAATTRGLSMQPLAQVVERADRELSAGLDPEFTNALAPLVPGRQVVLPFRIGYPTAETELSPRRPAEQVVVGA
jgi:nitroreductase